MEAIGKMETMINADGPVSFEQMIGVVSQRLLDEKSNNAEFELTEEVSHHLMLLSALVRRQKEYFGDSSRSQSSVQHSSDQLHKVWKLVFDACANLPSSPKQCVYEFLIACVTCSVEEDCKHYVTHLRGMMLTLRQLIEDQQKCGQNCQGIFSLIEMLLQNEDSSLVALRKFLTVELNKILLIADEALFEGPFLHCICRLVSASVKSIEDVTFCEEMWLDIYNTFNKTGQLFVRCKCLLLGETTLQEDTSALQYCLMLLDLLHDVSFYYDGINAQLDEEAICFTKTKILLNNPAVWVVIQYGLHHRKSFIRKQALFCLKKSISMIGGHSISVRSCLMEQVSGSNARSSAPILYWKDGMEEHFLSHWDDFILISETLEENQVHVINPVMKRWKKLVAASGSPNHDGMCLHTSWVCTILQRMITHESKAIIREGVMLSLQLDNSSFPFLQQETGEFFLCSGGEGLIPSLQDVNLFCDHRDNSAPILETPELPVVATLFQEFLKKCIQTHDNPERFLCFILKSLPQINWGPVPLYYICYAVASLPKTDAWQIEDLHTLRSLMTRCLRTHDGRLRSAIQEKLMQSLLLFTNPLKVSIEEVLRIILLCDVKVLFKSQSAVCKKISLWILSNFMSFSNIPKEVGDNIPEYILYKIEQYLVVASSAAVGKSAREVMKESQDCALLILLTVQGLHSHGDCSGVQTLTKILSRLSDITDKASTHLYMPREKTFKVIALLNQLFSWTSFEMCKDKDMLWQWLFKILQGLIPYLALQFPIRCLELEAADLCLQTCRLIMLHLEQLNQKKFRQQNISVGLVAMVKASLQAYNNNKNHGDNHLQLLISLKCLSWICQLLQATSIEFDQSTSCVISDFLSSLDLQARKLVTPQKSEETWGRIVEKYTVLQWLCIPYALHVQAETTVLINPCDALECFIDQVDTVTEDNLLVYFDALQTLVPAALKFNHEGEMCICECLDVAWKIVETSAHSPRFWKVYQGFVKTAFQRCTLSLPVSSVVQKKLDELLTKIATLASAKPALLQHACDACVQSWMSFETVESSQEIVDTSSVKIHSDFVVQCLTFHHICKRDDLALHNTFQLIEYETKSAKNQCNQNVTLTTVGMLLSLYQDVTEDCEFVLKVVQLLLQLDKCLTERKSRYHHNSIHHLMKNKVYQAVLMLARFVPQDEGESLILLLLNNLKNDAQPSVRYLMEWTLVVFLSKFPQYDELLLSRLLKCDSEDESTETQTASAKFSAVCSYLSVALLLGVGRNHTEFQEKYFMDLINTCMPWCMSQHFTTRLYALAVILKIKLMFENQGKSDVLTEKHPALASCLLFADESTGNVGRNWARMKDNFFLFDLDPVTDLSLQTIYGCLPRLCCVPHYATYNELKQICFQSRNEDGILKSWARIFNPRDILSRRVATNWIPQESKQSQFVFDQSERYRKNYGIDDSSAAAVDNVQKKVMPWLEAMEDIGRESESASRKEGLVLVASLIDKASNLGGLTRTCEIFGAEALVVQSMTCTTDKLYQSLSVTAHKWLPMKEVKPWQLDEYLRSMKRQGYTLIGTEQTAHSVCLSKYRFPQKCVVVLGNEKEGVPIPILKILDVCVQIPQKGIVRSLNVHVSGAITVWEYARQHLG